jgi:hypothetical protein
MNTPAEQLTTKRTALRQTNSQDAPQALIALADVAVAAAVCVQAGLITKCEACQVVIEEATHLALAPDQAGGAV